MPSWRIYYADGSTFSDEDGAPDAAPKFGAQVVLVKDGRAGRRVLRLADFYAWRPSLERWTDHEDATSALFAALQEPWIVIIAGKYLREADFERILIRAHNDADFPSFVTGKPHPAWST